MGDIGKGIATAGMWAGLVGMTYVCGRFEVLSAVGAGFIIGFGFVFTGLLWSKQAE